MVRNRLKRSGLAIAAAALGATGSQARPTARDFLVDEQIVRQADGATSHVRVYARERDRGDWISIVPSLGRGVEDYTEAYQSTLTTRLVDAGYRVILVQPRGIGKSSGNLDPATLSMDLLVDDLAHAFAEMGIAQVNLVGHAYGNRLSRIFATRYPSRIRSLVLIASGGAFRLNERQRSCLLGSFDMSLSREDRLEAIACAFFAKGNDPAIWFDGWYPDLAKAQAAASERYDGASYKAAGGLPFLLIQPGEDFIAPPELAGRALAAEFPGQVTYAEVPMAGHAITSEQPDLVASLIIAYLRRPAAKPPTR